MSVISIEQHLKEKQENESNEERCILCDGQHGDNTLCQMPWSA